MKLFFIANEVFLFESKDPFTANNGMIANTSESVFEAVTSCNMFLEDDRVHEGELAWSYMQHKALPTVECWSNTTRFFPLPSYLTKLP
jgi:hypothetical protein